MKNGEGFLLVYSITARSTFLELETLLEQIVRVKEREDMPIIIVGNKADLGSQRQVTTSEGEDFAKRHGCGFFEACANLRPCVDTVFYALTRKVLATRPDVKATKKKAKCTII